MLVNVERSLVFCINTGREQRYVRLGVAIVLCK